MSGVKRPALRLHDLLKAQATALARLGTPI